MDSRVITEKLRRHQTTLEELGVASLSVFGSAARGEDRPGSDVDVLVKFSGPPTFDRFMDLRMLLEEALGKRIDLVTESALRPALRGSIEREAVRVA